MAIMTTMTCLFCGETKQVLRSVSDYSRECPDCKQKARDAAEKQWKSEREQLSIEQRIRDIEHFMYHHGKHYNGPAVLG